MNKQKNYSGKYKHIRPVLSVLVFWLVFSSLFFSSVTTRQNDHQLFHLFFLTCFFLTVQIPAVIATIFIEKENSCSTYVKYSISIQLHFAKDTNISNNYNTSQSQMLLKSKLPTDAYH